MLKLDRLAFLTMALHGCGFMAAYELMQARPEPGRGLVAAALAHFACVVLAALALPALVDRGRAGRALACAVLAFAFAARLPGVGAWLDNLFVRCVIQMGQGALAAASYWVFFALTPREKQVRRYILAWLAGTAGKEAILVAASLAGDAALTVMYGGVGAVFALLVPAVSACLWFGVFPRPASRFALGRTGNRAFAVLAANTVLVALFLGLLSGWVGPFHTLWADRNVFAPRIAAPAILLLAGWRLSRDFRAGFRELTALCAVLCVAIATLAVSRWQAMPARNIPLLAVSCQTLFYSCMTLALVRVTGSPRLLGLAAAAPYAAMVLSGMVAYQSMPLRGLDLSVVLLLCLAVFVVFHFCAGRTDFSLFPFSHGVKSDGLPEWAGRVPAEQVYGHFGFTSREREVAALLSRGLTVADIARSMYVSRHTVNTHVRKMCEKIGVNNRMDLARLLADKTEGEDGASPSIGNTGKSVREHR